jgi:hypothetical protein
VKFGTELRHALVFVATGIMLAALPVHGEDPTGPEQAPEVEEDTGGNYEQCARFRADIDADLGEVLRAGCEPTLAQMSALMDNPIGNVAMLFNQYDAYSIEDPESGVDEFQHNYMLLFQFPKKLNSNWNLINRVVFNYTSVPLDQDDIDDFEPRPGFGEVDYQTLSGVSPASSPPNTPLPVELFEGRTTNLGDSYYVGLFAPNEPTFLSNGAKFLWGLGFDLGFDTAADDVLGTGKWTAGPSALGVYMGDVFKGGGTDPALYRLRGRRRPGRCQHDQYSDFLLLEPERDNLHRRGP